ncbi:MAG: LGFP repeat-containing protein, partial [bacterium]
MLSLKKFKAAFFTKVVSLCVISPLVGSAAMGHPTLQSNSPIQIKYNQLGGAQGFLGKPATEERATPDGIGKFRHFAGGSIYWHPKTGAHEVHGDIRKKWSELGWEKSFLGYPTTDETTTPDKAGRFNHFQGGSIYWHPKTGAHEVHGDIRKKWSELGWEKSFLGYPTTDETATPDKVGRFNHFQGGSIYWHPQTGVKAKRNISDTPVSDEPHIGGGFTVVADPTVRGVYDIAPRLFYLDAEFEITSYVVIHPQTALGSSIWFYWDLLDIPDAQGVLWQVILGGFPPFYNGRSTDLRLKNLVSSGYGVGRKGSFKVDFVKL